MLVQVLLEEAKKLAIRTLENSIDNKIEEILTRPSFYSQLNCFPKEIAAQKLVNCAKRCLKKYKNDYKIGSFNNLVEWRRRCRKGIQLFIRGSKTLNNFARESELHECPVIRASQIVYERRNCSIAIKSRRDVQLLVLLHKLDQTKLEDFDNYPLASQLGLIHAIPGEDFDMVTTTIIDVIFLGFFSKMIFQMLRKYKREINRCHGTTVDKEFKSLINSLIAAVVYKPITIQKVIQILLVQHKDMLAATVDENDMLLFAAYSKQKELYII